MAEFEIYTDDAGEYRWRFRANNGEIVADSAEGYVEKRDCERGMEILREEVSGARVDDKT